MTEQTPLERAAQALAERCAMETEDWCKKAIAKGSGWRVWRSDSRHERGEGLEHLIVYDFQLLPPNAPAPGSGIIFGPWTQDMFDAALGE